MCSSDLLPLFHSDFAGAVRAWLNDEFKTSITINEHVLPDVRKRLIKLGTVFDETQRVGCCLGRILILRRARERAWIGAIGRLKPHEVINLGLDAIDDDVGLAALAQLCLLGRSELLAVVVVPITLGRLARRVRGLLGFLDPRDKRL